MIFPSTAQSIGTKIIYTESICISPLGNQHSAKLHFSFVGIFFENVRHCRGILKKNLVAR